MPTSTRTGPRRGPARRTLAVTVTVTVAAALAAGCAGSGPPHAAPPNTPPPKEAAPPLADAAPAAAAEAPAAEASSLIAHARGPALAVFAEPAPGPPELVLDNPRDSGAPLVLLVERDAGGGWLEARLPVRPNGATGWIRRADVELAVTAVRVEVHLGARRLVAFDGAEPVLDTTVAVGAPATPTPTGRFFVTELLAPSNPHGPYGRYAFGLSGHSEELAAFAGGDATVGLHGAPDPRALGQAVSHGCIRLSDSAITTLAGLLPLGAPVDVLDQQPG